MIGLVKLTFAYQTRWYNYSHELRMQGRNSINSNPPPEGLTLKQVNLKVVSWVKGASCPRGSCCDGEEKIGGIDLNEMIRLTARLKRSPHPGHHPGEGGENPSQPEGGDEIKPRVNRDSGRFNRGVMRVVRSP
ncbi:hypothetical protein I7I51_06005 [Histoplasma capsulatum]|uniref:Uncharacterized protein n=1 Tax=Ajellomyces capsulatus TaxID=5037 RepID=A0A8A1MKH2_AJECA|nr:hypothetical protein I7I51_06005 [Histoplasma capsulatum]